MRSNPHFPPSPRPCVVYLHRYPPAFEARQWAALTDLLTAWVKDHRVVYVSMSGKEDAASVLPEGVEHLRVGGRVDPSRIGSKILSTLGWYLRLPWTLRRIRRLHPSAILCKETLPGIPGWTARLGVPVLIAVSDWWPSILLGRWSWGRRLARRMEVAEVRGWARRDTWVIANSHAEARDTAARGMPDHRIRVVNAPGKVDLFHPVDGAPVRASLGLEPRHWVVAVHGFIRPGKGYGQLMEWWRAAVAKHPDWRLLVIGGGGGERWLDRQIRRCRLAGHVLRTGWLPSHEDVNRHLNAADCLLVVRSNTPDNLGIIPSALYHSLATGRPTVATGLPGMREIIQEGRSGATFEPDDPESFLSVLESVEADPEAARRMGEAGRERAREQFSVSAAVAGHVDLLRQVIHG